MSDIADTDHTDTDYSDMGSGCTVDIHSELNYTADYSVDYSADFEADPVVADDKPAAHSAVDLDSYDRICCYYRLDCYNLPCLFPFA